MMLRIGCMHACIMIWQEHDDSMYSNKAVGEFSKPGVAAPVFP